MLAGLRRAYEGLEVAWDTWIVGLDLNDQVSILGNARDAVVGGLDSLRRLLLGAFRDGTWLRWTGGAVLLLGFLASLPWIYRRARRLLGRRRRPGPTAEANLLLELYGRYLEALARRGVRRPPHLTPLEFAVEAARSSGMPREVGELTDLFCRTRYGGQDLRAEDLSRARSLIRALGGA